MAKRSGLFDWFRERNGSKPKRASGAQRGGVRGPAPARKRGAK